MTAAGDHPRDARDGLIEIERCRLGVCVAQWPSYRLTCTMQRDTVTREPALPHLRTVAHGTQEGRVAAGALWQLAEDSLGQRRVESTQLGAEATHIARARRQDHANSALKFPHGDCWHS